MSFPLGEQFFIDSVRAGVQKLSEPERAGFAAEAQAFVGQEATHRRLHALFNEQLAAQGHVNGWERRIARRLERLEAVDVRHKVAITAAAEHLTAILSEHLLAHPHENLGDTEARLQTMWLWHASEESEHRSTAFDVYRALGGNERWRRRWFVVVTSHFIADLLRQTARNLAHDGQLWHWRTWRSAVRFLFGTTGVVRHVAGPWRAYLSSSFHPRRQGGERGVRWLQDNSSRYTPV